MNWYEEEKELQSAFLKGFWIGVGVTATINLLIVLVGVSL